jgi:hypothetical protein
MEYQAKEDKIAEHMQSCGLGAFADAAKRYFGRQPVHDIEEHYSQEQAYDEAQGQQTPGPEIEDVPDYGSSDCSQCGNGAVDDEPYEDKEAGYE